MDEKVTYLTITAGFSSTLYRGTTGYTRLVVTKTTENTPVNFNVRAQVSENIWTSDNSISFTSVNTEYDEINNYYREYFDVGVPQDFVYKTVSITAINSNSTTTNLLLDVSYGLNLVIAQNNIYYQISLDDLVVEKRFIDRGVLTQIAFTCLYDRVSNARLYIDGENINYTLFDNTNEWIKGYLATYTVPINYNKKVISIMVTDGKNTIDIPITLNDYLPEIITTPTSLNNIDENAQNVTVNVQYKNSKTINNPVVYVDGLIENIQYSKLNGNNYVFKIPATTYDKDYVIKFSMIDLEDNLIEKTLRFKQLVEEVHNTPNINGGIISPIWKDIKHEFSNDIQEFSITDDAGTTIYRGRSYKKPNSNSNSIYINRILENYLSIPDFNPYIALSARGGYGIFELRDENNTIVQSYHFVDDWSYSNDFKTGLLSHPIKNNQYAIRGQYLPFSLFADDTTSNFIYGLKYNNGTFDNTNVLISNDVIHNWFEDAKTDAEEVAFAVIGKHKIPFKDACNSRYVLYYTNSYGGYDWFNDIAKFQIDDSLQSYTYLNNYDNTTVQFGKKRYLTEIDKNITLTTGWLSNDESNRMYELIESNKVYLHDLWEDKVVPVIINNTDVEYKQKDKNNKIIQYQINLTYSQQRKRL